MLLSLHQLETAAKPASVLKNKIKENLKSPSRQIIMSLRELVLKAEMLMNPTNQLMLHIVQ